MTTKQAARHPLPPPHGGVFEDYGGPYVSYPTTSTSARAERATDVTLIPHRTDELHSWGSSASDATLQDDLTGQHDIWTMDGFYNGTTDTCTSDRLDIEADNLQHKGETQSHFPLHCSPITGAVSEAPVTSMHSTSSDRSVEVPPTNLDVAAQDCFNGQPSNLLHIAVKNGTTGILLSLIQAGANVSAVDETGSTPLHVAVHFGRAAMVEILIYHGADVNARDAAGASPLETAVRGQHEELVRVLLSRNAILS
ncbi:Ankyrin-3 [Beauveria bassiana]|uniref:Ankyrin-3 n=1 Tax=Beauveria bassiana TaxID=176275 RepID=A0A2N6NU80_BEABA|nr:Ankyrin-3 [Beauveria bassiana]